MKQKSVHGILALTTRTFILQIIAFGATFALTVLLTPSVFGVYYVVSAVISFLGYFSDIGLAAALIQKKEELTHEDLQTTFTVQQVLVLIAVVLALCLSASLGTLYGLDINGVWLLRGLAISFFLSSLKTIPSVLLERKLAFNKLIIPQIVETIVFYSVAVTLAVKGWGVTSFTFAVILRSVAGLVTIYILCPWSISLGISSNVAKRLLRFGIPFQLNSLLALVKDDLLTIVLGRFLTLSEIGYIGWAKKWAEVPLRLFMDSVIRVTFPAFARIQHAKDVLGKAIERTLFGVSLFVFPVSVFMIFFIHPFVSSFPRYAKWEPALVSFVFFVLTSLVASISTPLTNALNAIGKIKITLWFMVGWTVSTWMLTFLGVQFFGFNGVSIAMFSITISIVFVVSIIKNYIQFSFFSSLKGPIVGSLVQSIWYGILLTVFSHTQLFLLAIALSGFLVYAGMSWIIEQKRLKRLIADIYESRSQNG